MNEWCNYHEAGAEDGVAPPPDKAEGTTKMNKWCIYEEAGAEEGVAPPPDKAEGTR